MPKLLKPLRLPLTKPRPQMLHLQRLPTPVLKQRRWPTLPRQPIRAQLLSRQPTRQPLPLPPHPRKVSRRAPTQPSKLLRRLMPRMAKPFRQRLPLPRAMPLNRWRMALSPKLSSRPLRIKPRTRQLQRKLWTRPRRPSMRVLKWPRL